MDLDVLGLSRDVELSLFFAGQGVNSWALLQVGAAINTCEEDVTV